MKVSAQDSMGPVRLTARGAGADVVPAPAPTPTPNPPLPAARARDLTPPLFGRGDERVWVCRAMLARVAASDLQKRVLVELERHWAQVPGPLAQGFSFTGAGLAGGCVPDEWEDRLAELDASAAISAQMHGVPSWQNPQGSSMVWEAEAVVVEAASGTGR